MKTQRKSVVQVIGGGLAGSEAAWQLAERGHDVLLVEMRPNNQTPAHSSGWLAELICSNSLGSDQSDRAGGVLKSELRRLNSLIMFCADKTRIPAGGALAVGREAFSELVTHRIETHPRISVLRDEAIQVPDGPAIIASGPLTSNKLAASIAALIGTDYLYFYDALSPIVALESINMGIAFRASRYNRGENRDGDYINCPLDQDDYERFVTALITAERIELRTFETEDPHFFEGCLPIEEIASRGRNALAFGPMRPVGIIDSRGNRRPYAVVQLRQDNLAGTLYNIVGFQTNLRWPEQKRVLRLIPGLETAEFVRLGQMHRNTFLNSPAVLEPSMRWRGDSLIYFAGQITGIEGYVGNAASGLVAAVNLSRELDKLEPLQFPNTTMIGALCNYVSHSEIKNFQPMKANFGLMPPLPASHMGKRERYSAYAHRASRDLEALLASDSYLGITSMTNRL